MSLTDEFKAYLWQKRVDNESRKRLHNELVDLFGWGKVSTVSNDGKIIKIVIENVEIRFE